MAHKFPAEVAVMAQHRSLPRGGRKPPPTRTAAIRWSKEQVLAEARRRTRAIKGDDARETQAMLESLCKEAGWSSVDFLGALIQDVASKGKRH